MEKSSATGYYSAGFAYLVLEGFNGALRVPKNLEEFSKLSVGLPIHI